MPVLIPSYDPPAWLRGPHLQTVLPALLRRVPCLPLRRERLRTERGDVLALDWAEQGSPRLAVVVHGLEGDSRGRCSMGMARALFARGFDVLLPNARGCGGSEYARPVLYHSGLTEDLRSVVVHALAAGRHAEVVLAGLSMGGNQVLKYLGEDPERVPPQVRAAVSVGAPLDLPGAAARLDGQGVMAGLYRERFLRTLKAKVRRLARSFPGSVDTTGLEDMRTFEEFDTRYTARMHGFADALDYWRRAAAGPLLSHVRVRTLIVAAADDPFLSPGCYPWALAADSETLALEVPATGGHLGYVSFGQGRLGSWAEERGSAFLHDPEELVRRAPRAGARRIAA